MKKISYKQVKALKEKKILLDFHKFSPNIKITIPFKAHVKAVRFGEFYTNRDIMLFKYEMKKLIDVIKKILKEQDDKKCIVLKDNKKWMTETKKTKELSFVFKKNGLSNKKTEGIEIDIVSEWREIELLVESIFQCNTVAAFVLLKSQLILIPTDHMDIFVYCTDMDMLKKLEKIRFRK